MQVVAGEAIEGSYRVGSDGYVDLDYETSVCEGEVTSGQDAGVHTVRNGTPNGQPPGDRARFILRRCGIFVALWRVPGTVDDGSRSTIESTPTMSS